MRRPALGYGAAIVVASFAIVLAVGRDDRGLALFAFLLLVGGLVLAGVVAVLLSSPAASCAPLALAAAAPDSAPADLDQIEFDVREALATGIVDTRLRGVVHAVAAARLSRHHGIELPRDPSAARNALGDGPLYHLLARTSRDVVRMRAEELAAVIGELERL